MSRAGEPLAAPEAPADALPDGLPDAPPSRWARMLPVLPYLATLALFVLGIAALYHLLRDVPLAEVRQQVRQVPAGDLLLALLATAAGYAALVCYDWTALRYVGRVLPARAVALGGFLAYSIGNTVGISALSGGAVRYRVYSALGLNLADIARISTFVALAYGTGATMVGLGALIAYPDALAAVLPLPPALVRLLALAGFVVGNLVIWGSSLGRIALPLGRWRIEAPGPVLLAVQLAVTLAEMVMGALVLYLFLRADIAFVPFLAVYLAATMAGILSHVPGGVGVFETVIIATLPASVSTTDAAAALLAYRLVYFILPFMVALAMLAGTEGRQLATGRITALARALTGALVPLAMGAMVMVSGAVMMLVPMVPAASHLAREAEAALPLAFVETGALLSTALGAMLVLIAQGLLRRLAGAWWLTMAALAAGIGAALLDDWDVERALFLALAALLLLPCRAAFYRSTRLTRGALSPGWFLLVGAMLCSVVAVALLATHAAPYADATPWAFADDARAPRALRLGLTGCFVLALMTIWQALRRAPFRDAADTLARGQVEGIIARWGRAGDALALSGGKCFLLSDGGDAVIAYAVQGRAWVALGDPVGDPAQIPGLIWRFRDAARRARVTPVFYEASPRWFPQWIETGMTLFKLGEEAVVDLTRFSLEGPARKRLRGSHARARREGLSHELLAAGASDGLLEELRAISDRWLAARPGREKTFSVGRFDADWLRRFPLAVVRHHGRLVGFALVLLDGRGQGAAIDLMRHDPATALPVMEFLFTETMLALAAREVESLSLGVAPLAGLEEARSLAGRVGRLVYRHGGRFYGFRGLRQFKDKFDPLWEPRYLVLPRLSNPVAVVADVTRLISDPLRRAPAPAPVRPSPPQPRPPSPRA